jgi:hypothetical protein
LKYVQDPLLSKNFKCDTFYGGIFNSGYAESLEMYETKLRTIAKMNIPQFIMPESDTEKPSIISLIYAKELLKGFLSEKKI